ncbi:leucine-rich repeat-containing protein 74B [Aplysia californica]|uniref:Leucine-rich repeat-containing protein 74B n=1 Tax=Aplysia californica TaxID=6500 RepID=A0ABM1VSG5_APLCA|nr:leucine-rich repeat-containing protein 74B [Aplysia californica]
MEKERLSIKMQRHLRPLTAAPKKSRPSASKSGDSRPVTASVARGRGDVNGHKKAIARHSLQKSHLHATGRSSESDFASQVDSPFDLTPIEDVPEDSELIDIVEENNKTEIDCAVALESAELTPLSTESARNRHPSFETWLSGSPHSSEEFDTDVEDELSETPMSTQLDATGRLEYEEQCRRHGFIPVSYLCRHIGERNVRMRHRYLGGTATKPLALAFKHNTVTENLDLGDNYIESSGTCYIANMLKENHFITSLTLSNNVIGSLGAEAIAEMLEVNTTLKMLSLAGNQLSDTDAYHFINPLKNNMSLMSFDLSHNEFSVMGGIHLGGALSVNEGIVDLDLSWNCLRKQGAAAIVNCLRYNVTLEVLDLSWNGFGLEGAMALQKALPVNTTLKVLDLTNNRMDTKAAQKLALGLKKNTGLETLILSMNPLGDQGIEQILKALAIHPNLHFLGIENCAELGVTKANATLIQQLETERGIVILHGGAGGFNRTSEEKSVTNVMRLFNTFLKKKKGELREHFKQYDKDKTGVLQVDDVKICLRSAGLNLTNRFLNLLVEDMDSSHSGEINYKDILSGAAFSEHSRRRPSRGFQLLSKTKLEPDSDEG